MARVAFLVLIIVSFYSFAKPALAEISVDQTRIVLTPSSKTALITVQNTNLRTFSIKPSWTSVLQAEDASLYPTGIMTAPKDQPFVRLWLKTATSSHGKPASIQLLLDEDAPASGEIRRHLRLDLDPASGNGPRYAIVVPVFIRGTISQPQVRISGLHVGQGKNLLVQMSNQHGASPHGHLVAFDQDGQKLGELGNINLYDHTKQITFTLPLSHWPKSRITVRYLGDEEFTGMVFAETTQLVSFDPVR